jgi:membrane fusion protein (multidrug efflux system)
VWLHRSVVPKGILALQQGITRDAKGDATALVVDASNKVVLRNVVADKAIGVSGSSPAGSRPGIA